MGLEKGFGKSDLSQGVNQAKCTFSKISLMEQKRIIQKYTEVVACETSKSTSLLFLRVFVELDLELSIN